MTRDLAERLLNILKSTCPVRSGALRESISIIQFTAKEFIIQIGNESGAEMNGGTPTNVYASITNQRYLRFRNRKTGEVRVVPNKKENARWVNRAIERWIKDFKLNLDVLMDEEEDYEQI